MVSILPEATILLSGENATKVTTSLCPFRVVWHYFEIASHNFIVLSAPPETINLPSGEYATEHTVDVWPPEICNR